VTGRRLRIALLAPASALHTVRWANALAARGHAVELISLHASRGDLDPAVRLHRLGPKPPAGYVLAAEPLRRLLAGLAPDLVNAHYASGYGTLARRAAYRPWALSIWGSDVYLFPRASPLHRWLIGGNLRAADRVFSTSRAMAEQALQLAPGLAMPYVTPFGVDTERFTPQDGAPRDEAAVTVGTVKALAPTYGIDRLLHAFALARGRLAGEDPEVADGLCLRIAGDGPQRRELERLAGRLGIAERVTFSGAITHAQVPAFLGGLNVFVALSRSESFGVAVLEAAACGLPSVVTNVGGLPEVVADGATGLVVPDGDLAAAAAALVALAADPPRRARMGREARRFVAEQYEWSRCVTVMEEGYAALVGDCPWP
jgi:glycosyltransferase involved in cell wall biosynthesis